MSLEIDAPAAGRRKDLFWLRSFWLRFLLLDTFWIRFGCTALILVTFWLRLILVAFWLRFGYVLVAYNQGSGPTQRSTPRTNQQENQEDSTRSMSTRSRTSAGTISSISPKCAAHLKCTSPVWELYTHQYSYLDSCASIVVVQCTNASFVRY